MVGYGIAFHFLALTLKTIPGGRRLCNLGRRWRVTIVAIVGWLLFGQKLDAPAIIGMALIVTGVVVMQAFSKSAGH